MHPIHAEQALLELVKQIETLKAQSAPPTPVDLAALRLQAVDALNQTTELVARHQLLQDQAQRQRWIGYLRTATDIAREIFDLWNSSS